MLDCRQHLQHNRQHGDLRRSYNGFVTPLDDADVPPSVDAPLVVGFPANEDCIVDGLPAVFLPPKSLPGRFALAWYGLAA